MQHVRSPSRKDGDHIVFGEDQNPYYARFYGEGASIQGLTRQLVSYLLQAWLELPIPLIHVLELSPWFTDSEAAFAVSTQKDAELCRPGNYLGVHFHTPEAVFGYMPVVLLRALANRETFLGMLAFDKWAATHEYRSVVFHRTTGRYWCSPHLPVVDGQGRVKKTAHVGVVSWNGNTFGPGLRSRPLDPGDGLCRQREVYEDVESLDRFDPWLSKIVNVSPDVLSAVYRNTLLMLPEADPDYLDGLMQALYCRRSHVPDLIRAARHALCDPFPSWR